MDTTQDPTPAVGSRCLQRIGSVSARTGLGVSEIWRRVAAGTFPRQVKLGRHASAWDAAEVDAWIAAQVAMRDAS